MQEKENRALNYGLICVYMRPVKILFTKTEFIFEIQNFYKSERQRFLKNLPKERKKEIRITAPAVNLLKCFSTDVSNIL